MDTSTKGISPFKCNGLQIYDNSLHLPKEYGTDELPQRQKESISVTELLQIAHQSKVIVQEARHISQVFALITVVNQCRIDD